MLFGQKRLATIFCELLRCQPYRAKLTQADAEYKRARCGRKIKLNAKLKQTILNHLRLSWSPEVIAHELKLATKSIYNWLNQPDKVDIEIIHKNLLTVIGSAERPFGYWTALVHKRFRF